MTKSARSNYENMLAGTPYLIEDGDAGLQRFKRVLKKATQVRERAIKAAAETASTAEQVLSQFEDAVRSDLVAESERLEGYDTTASSIQDDLTLIRRQLIETDTSALLEFLRREPRFRAMGLFTAYEIADQWAAEQTRPWEHEIRQLHALVMPNQRHSGRYRDIREIRGFRIQGSDHIPPETYELANHMADFAMWFREGTGDAALDATVAHAWLTHIHPFEDGNGRMARLLANLALVQEGFPSLLIRSETDRGRYLEALAISDEGDLLPLYDLFVAALRRNVIVMEKPNYVHSKISRRLFTDVKNRHDAFRTACRDFRKSLETKLVKAPWSVVAMGTPSIEDYELLENEDRDGNSWFLKLRHRGVDEWLLFFGYKSPHLKALTSNERSWPSIFVSQRTSDPTAVHPFKCDWGSHGLIEIGIRPAAQKPALVRTGQEVQEVHLDEAAQAVAEQLCQSR